MYLFVLDSISNGADGFYKVLRYEIESEIEPFSILFNLNFSALNMLGILSILTKTLRI